MLVEKAALTVMALHQHVTLSAAVILPEVISQRYLDGQRRETERNALLYLLAGAAIRVALHRCMILTSCAMFDASPNSNKFWPRCQMVMCVRPEIRKNRYLGKHETSRQRRDNFGSEFVMFIDLAPPADSSCVD